MFEIENLSKKAKFFDSDTSPLYDFYGNHETVLMFLKIEEQIANCILDVKGVVTLEEVYKRLGISSYCDPEPLIYGWTKNVPGFEDQYVDFGITELEGYDGKKTILLNFNANCWIDD